MSTSLLLLLVDDYYAPLLLRVVVHRSVDYRVPGTPYQQVLVQSVPAFAARSFGVMNTRLKIADSIASRTKLWRVDINCI